jgi:hypothetical protein
MSVTIDSSGVQLVGDAFGGNWARKQLAAAPATAMRMKFAYRIYMDAFSADYGNLAAGWNHTNGFGLRFAQDIIEFDETANGRTYTPDDFLGVCNIGPVHRDNDVTDAYPNAVMMEYISSTFLQLASTNVTGMSELQFPCAFLDGNGAVVGTINPGGDTATEHLIGSIPANATHGATYAFGWEVFGSAVDKTVWLRLCRDAGSLSDANLLNVFDAPAVDTTYTIHGDETSNWRNADGAMNFPRWLMMRYSLPVQKMILKTFKMRFYDISENVIG